MSELGAAFRDIFDAFARELHSCLPCQVVAYDNATQTCSVQPMVKRVVVDEDGNESVESLPQITGVPVGFYVAGGFMMTFPIAAGDTGLIVFSELPVDTFLSTGNESDPGDLRHHSLADAFFLPAVRPSAKALSDASADTLAIGKSGGPQIHVNASTVNIGEKAAAAFIARADLVDARLTALENHYIAHVHPTALGPSGVTAPALTPGSSTAATKGKVT